MASDPGTVFAVVGEAGITDLVAAFFRRVPTDPVLASIYPEDDLAGAEERLRLFLVYRLGGPPAYLEQRGHPRMRMRHAPFAIDQTARDHWVDRMNESLDEQRWAERFDGGAAAAATLREFLAHVATFLINRS